MSVPMLGNNVSMSLVLSITNVQTIIEIIDSEVTNLVAQVNRFFINDPWSLPVSGVYNLDTGSTKKLLHLTLFDPIIPTTLEIVEVISIDTTGANTILNVNRGMEGTTGLAWAIGIPLELRSTTEILKNLMVETTDTILLDVDGSVLTGLTGDVLTGTYWRD